MTGRIEFRSFTLPETTNSSIFSLLSLLRASYLLLRVVVPLAAVCLTGMAALDVLYQRNPTRADTMRNQSIDHLIVLEQVHRAATLPAAEVAFLGDSSCLMGIVPAVFEGVLERRPIYSFCVIGYVGPAGYAHMLGGMIERNAAPKTLVLMFHPETFRRDPTWDYWSTFVMNAGKVAPPSLKFPRSALDYLEFEVLSRLIYSPLPRSYGRYYGGEGEFRATIQERNGSAVDPYSGLNISSMIAVGSVPQPPIEGKIDYAWNQSYSDALRVLGATLTKLPSRTEVYLVIAPVPDSLFRPEMEAARAERASEIAATLGLDSRHILETPAKMPADLFSSHTHLNRWGQLAFSDVLARQLAAAISAKPTN